MSTKTLDRAAYVEKVRKLLAKAEGASTTEEAETFFAKAQSLITKWEIEEAELRDAKAANGVSWKIEVRIYPLSSFSPRQDAYAIKCVAEAMGLRVVYSPYVRGVQKGEAHVFGTDEDLDRYEMMWASVSLQMTRLMKAQEKSSWNRNQQRTFRLGFKTGFGERVGERIREARDSNINRAVKSTELVLVGKSEAIEQALPEGIKKSTMKVNGSAKDAGRAAAEGVDIGQYAAVTA